MAQSERLLPRLVRLEPLLRQLRSGQQHLQHGERPKHLHRLVEYRRRRRPPALGLQVRRPPRDRRHQIKVYGSYSFNWKGSVGAYAIYQSGQPWEYHSYEPYISQTTSTSDVNRYSEPAGSHLTDDHYQLDLNYTQTIPIGDTFRVEARIDVFNVFDKQTGYNVQDNVHTANPGTYQTFIDPRRLQFALKVEF